MDYTVGASWRMPSSFINSDIAIGFCVLVVPWSGLPNMCRRVAAIPGQRRMQMLDSFSYIEGKCHIRIAYGDGTVKGSHSAAAFDY